MSTATLLHEPTTAEALLAGELAAIESALREGRVEQCLRSLDERGAAQELVSQQYHGRYPFELLQNANDAIAVAREAARPSALEQRVRFVLTDTSLIVANTGAGFGEAQVKAICSLGRSSKDPRKTIGYKGLGFKSVGEITDTPQVLSGEHRFAFDTVRARLRVEQIVELESRQRLPTYAFPLPLTLEECGVDREVVERCLADGFISVLRLPFRQGVERSKVSGDLETLLSPRLLVLLDAMEVLEVAGTRQPFSARCLRDAAGDRTYVVLQADGQALEDWLVFQERVAIPASELVAKLGGNWPQVTEVRIAVAIPLKDGRPNAAERHSIHVYFPTDDGAGLAFLVHADFALELDRRRLSAVAEPAKYNDWLLGEVVRMVANRVAPALVVEFPRDPAVVDLLVPRDTKSAGAGARKLRTDLVAALRESSFVPVVSGAIVRPVDALLLPPETPVPTAAHGFLDLAELPNLVLPEIESSASTRGVLALELGRPCSNQRPQRNGCARRRQMPRTDFMLGASRGWTPVTGVVLPVDLRMSDAC